MFSKMRMAILLLFIGVCNGRPRINWDNFYRRMETMGERLGQMGERMGQIGERMGEDSDIFLGDSSMEDSREDMYADREKYRQEREKYAEEREKQREQRQREREIREKEREERREEREREREAYWEKFDSEMDEKFNVSGLEGNDFISNGNTNVVTIGNNYYHSTSSKVIDGVEYLTVTNWNQATEQYDSTYYRRNANDPNAQFVPVNQS